MAEKKKRVRPTLTQVRALQNELDALKVNYEVKCKDVEVLRKEKQELSDKLEEQINGTSTLVSDCDAWREKFRKLNDEFDEYKNNKSNADVPKKCLDELQVKYDELKKNHGDVCARLDAITEEKKEMEKDLDEHKAEVLRLRMRGLWARIFNL
jgi:chromosome segregation ATPase